MSVEEENLLRTLLEDVPGLDRHVWNPLREAGYRYLDEVKGLPIPDLCAIVTGPRAQAKLFAVLGRLGEWDQWRGNYKLNVGGQEVSGGEINQVISLRGTARYFLGADATVADLKQALDEGRVSRDQVAAYLVQGRQARRDLKKPTAAVTAGAAPVAAKAEDATAASTRRAEMDQKIAALVAKYEEEYDTRRWNQSDRDMVRRLAMMEIFVAGAQENLLERGPEAIFMYATQVKSLSDQIATAMNQIRQMRDELEISLKARAQKEVHSEAHEVLTDFAKQAKQLVAERASILVHCGVRLALCLPYFPKHLRDVSVTVVCPVCGEVLRWELVTPAMLETYVEAGDFVPHGAPVGAFEQSIEVKEVDEFKGIQMGRIS